MINNRQASGSCSPARQERSSAEQVTASLASNHQHQHRSLIDDDGDDTIAHHLPRGALVPLDARRAINKQQQVITTSAFSVGSCSLLLLLLLLLVYCSCIVW